MEILAEEAVAAWTVRDSGNTAPCLGASNTGFMLTEVNSVEGPQAGQGLEELSSQQWLRELGVFSLEESFGGT